MNNNKDHINEEKLDIYVLNKELPGSESVEINNHLSICNECLERYNKLVAFYEGVKNSPPVNVTFSEIQNILKKRRIDEEVSIETIFKHKKIPLSKRIKSFFGELSLTDTAPALRWSLAGAAALILVALLYWVYIKPGPQIVKDQDQGKDTTQKPKLQETQHDTNVVKEEPWEEEKKKEKKQQQKKPMFGVTSHLIVSGVKGSYNEYGFVKGVDNSNNSSVLFVYSKEKYDKNKKPDELVNSKSETYRILFNKFPSSKSTNNICSIEPGKYGIEITTAENSNCDDKSYEVKYQFDKDFNLKDVEFKYEFVVSFGADIEGTNDEKAEKFEEQLKSSIKYWNGKTYIKRHITLNP